MVGAGILGLALANVISSLCKSKITILEQEAKPALHTSSRNTGKVHAPFIYHPEKKRVWAKAALYGYQFWKNYCEANKIPFEEDGVLEVATDADSAKILSFHLDWGIKNGLNYDEIKLLDQNEVKMIEPHVKCHQAILCKKDASVDYGQITRLLANHFLNNDREVKIATLSKVINIKTDRNLDLPGIIEYQNMDGNAVRQMKFDFLINASGSNALNVMNTTKIEHGYQDLFFLGEYWIAPSKYNNLTRRSIYSIPQFHQFPFLDPHWIIRTNGHREIGPNACPVFSPYGYDKLNNLKEFFPKLYKLTLGEHRINKSILRKEMFNLVATEALSSVSKRYMIKRVKKFLPSIEAKDFTIRGTSGIRANIIDKNGDFISSPIFKLHNNVLHILNYNSPGATGVFPIAYALVFKLVDKGILRYNNNGIEQRKLTNLTPFDEKLIENCRKEIEVEFK
ncbi:NAD(P)/FAD-dependent oxidoreductase [Candidatus Nitrosocosmicus agrestis]|uniref:NAD(P)/FAD-dependent oxidoreductase n=1 Tax=Candidatus Nitrosocosmicus agrestis TaxID=2563600 RepID=UPI002104CF72|nr:FAD-dependent oxidoreductase [Candidatus Nitrosocosmicus sp. SS]